MKYEYYFFFTECYKKQLPGNMKNKKLLSPLSLLHKTNFKLFSLFYLNNFIKQILKSTKKIAIGYGKPIKFKTLICYMSLLCCWHSCWHGNYFTFPWGPGTNWINWITLSRITLKATISQNLTELLWPYIWYLVSSPSLWMQQLKLLALFVALSVALQAENALNNFN